MSQPMHLRAPAYPATPTEVARIAPSLPLDGWSSLSPVALPVLAPLPAQGRCGWPRLVSAPIPRLQSARAA